MEKAGNRYYALIYKSREMHYQRKELPFSWDKMLLYFNWVSNNHGISWIKGIRFTLLISLMGFLLLNMMASNPSFHLNLTHSSFTETITTVKIGFKEYVIYLCSFPKLTIEGLDESNWKVAFILTLNRILIGIGIYQTISAFRKYAK